MRHVRCSQIGFARGRNALTGAFLVVPALLATPKPAPADDGHNSTVEKFRNEYPAAFQRLEHSYAQLNLKYRTIYGGARERTYTYWSDGRSLRVDAQNADGRRSAQIRRNQQIINVSQRAPDAAFSVQGLQRISPAEANESDRLTSRLPFAATSLFETDLQTLLLKSAKIVNGRREGERGELAVIEFEDQYLDGDGRWRPAKGTCVFDIERGWILREFTYHRLAFPARQYAEIDYRSLEDGTLVPSRYVLGKEHPESGVREPTETTTLLNADRGPVSSDVFRLTSFGIPDDITDSPRPAFGHWELLLLVNAVLIAAAIACLWLARRSRSRSPTAEG